MFNAIDLADIPRIRADYAAFPPGAPVEECFDLADEGEEEIHTLLKVWSVRVLLRIMDAQRTKKLLRVVINYSQNPKTQALIDAVANAIAFIESEDAAGVLN
jgi:hypothetical protein